MVSTYLKIFLFFIVQVIVDVEQTKGGLSITFKDRYLAGHIFAVNYPKDWLKCSISCQKTPKCVSYNFNLASGSCELSEHGIREDFKADEQLTEAKDFIFHQIRPIVKDILPPKRTVDNQCDCNCVSHSACTPNPDVNNKLLSFSCKDLWEKNRPNSGVYDIRSDDGHGKVSLYCEMGGFPGCGDGGWTLVMKIKGSENTFTYNSSLWSNKEPFHPENGQDLLETETKLPSYWLTPMTKLCLGMKHDGQTSWISISQSGTSLYDVIMDNNLKTVEVPLKTWMSLLANSSLETGCVLRGFNVDTGHKGAARARIGVIGFTRNCSTPSKSRLGYGTSGDLYGMDDTNSCGNEDGTTGKKIKAFGYVFVQ